MAEGGQKRDPSSHRTPAQVTRQVKGYNARPENVRKRSMRNQAREILTREYGKPALAGKDVGHRKMVKDGGTNARSNLKVQDRSENRGWRDD
jgi:hypothetical protein